jgi:hypothetical protein
MVLKSHTLLVPQLPNSEVGHLPGEIQRS